MMWSGRYIFFLRFGRDNKLCETALHERETPYTYKRSVDLAFFYMAMGNAELQEIFVNVALRILRLHSIQMKGEDTMTVLRILGRYHHGGRVYKPGM